MERYFAGEEFSDEELIAGIRQGVKDLVLAPVDVYKRQAENEPVHGGAHRVPVQSVRDYSAPAA